MENQALSPFRFGPLSLDEVWDRVDPLAPDFGLDVPQTGLAGLPYFSLGGTGFERLIYELLQTENQRPWFFGRTGQAQFGIDIITEVAGKQNFYQCKNYGQIPSWPTVRKAVEQFESQWLNDMGLTSPGEFVYCCPQPLQDSSFLVEWERFKDAFQKRTGVTLSFWERNAIDSRLRKLPDLVAGLFSDSYAEHFCGRDEWRDDPWVRVKQGPARFRGIDRFLDRHNRKAIYVSDVQEKLFLAAVDQTSTVALRGLPGMGKSFLALELACRLRQPLRRIYYATFKDATSAERLWQSARRRFSLPSLFVLDDCHLAPQAVDNLLERLNPELRSGQLKLVLCVRDQVRGAVDQPDDTDSWLVRLQEEQAIIDLRVDTARTLAVTCHLRPDFTGLAYSRLERLHKTCGGDLLLLDEILPALATPQDVDILDVGGILASVRNNYFDGNRRLPTLTKLAALAQFDLLPQSDFFEGEWQAGEQSAADPLMTRLFAPPRYQFLHSSLATLILFAQAQLEAGDAALDEKAATITVQAVTEYLSYLSTSTDYSDEFQVSLHQFLRTRPHLGSALSEARARSAVLGDEAIQDAIDRNLPKLNFSILGMCVRWVAIAEHPAKAFYLGLIERRMGTLFEQPESDEATIGTVGIGLRTLRKFSPDIHVRVLNRHGSETFLRLILANGSLSELFKILENSTSEFRTSLLDRLTSEQAEALIHKAIVAGRSIGTLNLAMREIGNADPTMLARLERVVGAPGLLRLILANGFLLDLFRVLQYSTPGFRGAMLDQITSQLAEVLINKTVATGRSIGTLHLAMRELGDADPTMLARLERVVGVPGYLRLIVANGTLFELFNVLQYSTPGFRRAMLDHLTSELADALIDKTVVAGRSVGTLNLAMRELGNADPTMLARLERFVGASGFLRLILANGTLFELFNILQYSTPGFRRAMLDHVTSELADALIDKTVAAGRSIGTLSLAMRELGDADPTMLARLERFVGASGFLRLILANGTLFDLFMVIQRATPILRKAMLDQITSELADALLDKTVAAGRSIGTLHLAMRELGDADPTMLARLERAVGAPGFLRLILANGTLFELFKILENSTSEFRTSLLDQLTSEQTQTLIEKSIAAGRSIGTLDLAMRELGDADPKMLARLEQIVGAQGFVRLILANGTLVELFRVLRRATPEFRTALLDQVTSAQPEALIDKTIAEGRRMEDLHFALRSCGAKLEKWLGVEGWLKLLIGCGSLNAVSQIIQASTNAFRARMIAAAIKLSAEDWVEIINRGLFLNACNFVTNDLSSYPTAAREAFRAALELVAAPLAAKATWFDLNPSRPPDEPIAEGAILGEALRDRMEAVQLTELFELDFREAVNAFACCWRERPDLRLELAANLRTILPPRETWPREKGEVAGVRLILGLSRSPEFPKAELRWLVAEIRAFLDRDVYEDIHTFPLFLLVWNICASFYDRGLRHKFGDPFTDAELELMLSVLTDRVSAKGPNPEKLEQLALGGLLAISFPQLRSPIINLFASLKGATHWLVALAMDQTFLPALFALEGIALNTDRKIVFSRERCAELLRKFEEYEDVGPAMNALRNHVLSKHKRQ